MNSQDEQKKIAITKGLAVVGFVTGILLLVWLAVQAVSLLPSAIGSLASLADSVYNYNDDVALSVTSDRTVVNSGDTFEISWNELSAAGYYTFSIDCTNGASASTRIDNQVTDLQCGSEQRVSAPALELVIRTEQRRFIDVPYIVSFIPDNDPSERRSDEGIVTVVNASIPASAGPITDEPVEDEPLVDNEPTDDTATSDDMTDSPIVDEPAPEPVPQTPTAPVTPPAPQYVETVTYEVPVSDPNGYVDLRVQFLGVGILDDDEFVFRGEIPTDEAGAIHFTVRNAGTKTSDDWTFTANLPSDIAYTSDTQEPLKPNEIATITVGFEGINRTGLESFSVDIDTDEDRDRANNDFSWAVYVVE